MKEDYIKLIFGLKLKQIRTEKGISLFGLSKLTGLSKSYLSEVEKGKKYPKPDKIAILSEKLEVTYDHMVSLKLEKNLAPVGRILRGRILKEIPLDHFGIKESTLIDIISNAPAKVNAFINTIIKIAQDYSFTRESFYLASVRSHQEANNNFFEDLEAQALKFAKAYHIDIEKPIQSKELEDVLIEEFGYTINKTELSQQEHLDDIRSIYIAKTKTLLVSNAIDDAQLTFIYAKEIAYNFLKIKDRLYTFPWIKFDTFDQVLNNFNASYFAGALLVSRTSLTENLKVFFESDAIDLHAFSNLIDSYNASVETFYQRLTNIFPKDFNLQNLFFMRLSHQKGSYDYSIEKELNLIHSQQKKLDEEASELYRRRWSTVLSLRSQNTKSLQRSKIRMSIVNHPKSQKRYLIFSSTILRETKKGFYRSICLGFLIDSHLERKLKFLNSFPDEVYEFNAQDLSKYQILDSQNRIEKPIVLEKQSRNKMTEDYVNALMADYS